MSWFRFYPDDFIGGTLSGSLSATDSGHYLYLLIAQFGSKDRKAIPADLASLSRICFGDPPSERVLAKFEEITIHGQKCLRNKRMAEEWDIAKEEYDARKRGAERTAERTAERDAEQGAERIAEQGAAGGAAGTDPRAKIQEPGAKSQESGSQEPKPSTEYVVTLERFTKVFNAAYSRRVSPPALNGVAQKQLKSLLKAYGQNGLCCLPLLAAVFDGASANGRDRLKSRTIQHLFHDGTNGTHDWGQLYQQGETLSPRVMQELKTWELAKEFGLVEALQGFGLPRIQGT
jgi:uncharacterized protein YdaU (DUF1376 family)